MKRRYMFVKKRQDIKGLEVLSTFRNLFGLLPFYDAQPKLVAETSQFVVYRVASAYTRELRVSILLTHMTGSLYTLVVSGTIRGLVRRVRERREGALFWQSLQAEYLKGRKR